MCWEGGKRITDVEQCALCYIDARRGGVLCPCTAHATI